MKLRTVETVPSKNATIHTMSTMGAYEHLIKLPCTNDTSAQLYGFESYTGYHHCINEVRQRMNGEMSQKKAAKLRLKISKKRWIAQCTDFYTSERAEEDLPSQS